MARVSINIVSWNGMKFLPEALETIFNQTYKDFQVVIVDNGSTDGTVDYIRNNYPQVALIRNVKNLGFAHGHNQAIRMAMAKWPAEELNERFILVTNQDILFQPDFLEHILRDAEAHPAAASFTGKLFKAYFNQTEDGFDEVVRSDTLDSTGLVIKKSHRVYDRGAGENDQKQYDNERDIFGASGAILLLRGSALAEMRYGDEFFDEDFFLYKEDIDLAWRLRLAGWKSRYVPEARAYHYRGAYSPARSGWLTTIMNRRRRSALVNFYSFVNHYFLYIKNERASTILRYLPWIFFYELKKNLYTLIFEPKIYFGGYARFFSLMPKMLRKRRHILAKAKATPGEIRRWFE